MKRAFFIILTLTLAAAMLAGCAGGGSGPAASGTPAPSSTGTATPAPPYSFELEDTDGNVHKLSDYAGKPVYLEIWGTWCSVCMSSLPDLDKFAGEQHDFTVLSVVSPGASGEKNREDFIAWYNEQGYENLTVLLDDDWQILNDFGVNAYPSILIFDANGAPVTGFAGLVPEDTINEVMREVTNGTYNG
jgi:thiol-disulfide isomerase/thioredoxin